MRKYIIVKIDDLKSLDRYFEVLADIGKELRFKEPEASKTIIKYAHLGRLNLLDYLKYPIKEFSIESVDINTHISELKRNGILKDGKKENY